MTLPSSCRDLADVAEEATGVDPQYFVDNIHNYGGYTVEAWKYGARRKSREADFAWASSNAS